MSKGFPQVSLRTGHDSVERFEQLAEVPLASTKCTKYRLLSSGSSPGTPCVSSRDKVDWPP